jgi:hypothetical protein
MKNANVSLENVAELLQMHRKAGVALQKTQDLPPRRRRAEAVGVAGGARASEGAARDGGVGGRVGARRAVLAGAARAPFI